MHRQRQHHHQQDQHLPEPTVRVAQGLVRGRRAVSKQGDSYLSFQGLPYAEPPVGPLRFKPPQPPQPWGGELAALQPPPPPLQKEGRLVCGKEDCLYLNVYTPQIEPGVGLPVMVWIFGGGFVTGSGNPDLYGPDYLVDAGVVLVTLNYRLGVLGFLSLCNADAAGNMGLKDQVAALRWVRENIGAFGGDRDNVTIFGESAGGASVTYHMLSPMSKGLFHKAIAQSGSALNPWAFTRASRARARAFRLGELLGCRTEDERQLMDCLMAADADTLVKHADKMFSRMVQDESVRFIGRMMSCNAHSCSAVSAFPSHCAIRESNSPLTKDDTTCLMMAFVPTVEPVVEGQEALLTEEPETLLKGGKFHRVPYIGGIVTNEGSVMLRAPLKDPAMFTKMNENFSLSLPLGYKELHPRNLDQTCKNIRGFYFKNEPLSRENISHFSNFLGDLQLASGVYITAKGISASSSVPVFFYHFSFDGELGHAKKQIAQLGCDIAGPYHGDDVGYLFRINACDPDLDSAARAVKIRNLMVKLWTNFAYTGDPNPIVDENNDATWLPFDLANESYLKIDDPLCIDTQLWKTRMAFWENNKTYHKL